MSVFVKFLPSRKELVLEGRACLPFTLDAANTDIDCSDRDPFMGHTADTV